MASDTTTFALLYTSKLLGDPGGEAITEIATVARRNNARDGIGGVLVFDGSLFAQWLEGERDKLDALLGRIRADRRHAEVQVHHLARVDSRRFTGWKLGFLFPNSSDKGLFLLRRLEGEAAADAFLQLLPNVEMI